MARISAMSATQPSTIPAFAPPERLLCDDEDVLPANADAVGQAVKSEVELELPNSALVSQCPNELWQPVPQNDESPPQCPFPEQQSPNVDPRHIVPVVPLHVPSVLTVKAVSSQFPKKI